MLLALPSLRAGWVADDYIHRAKLLGSPRFAGLLGSRTELFGFFDGDSEHTRALMDIGLLPWWTDPHIRGAFWRPVTVATHLLDYALWPHNAAMMHAHSVVWLGAMVLVVTFIFRRFLDPTWAALAAILYAIDDARGTPVGFLANRNAMVATFFGAVALLAHDRWRRNGSRTAALGAWSSFVLSLLSGEIGVSTAAFLAAYAVFKDTGPRWKRWCSLLPYAAALIAWRTTWRVAGYGVDSVGPYIDPLASPLRFLEQVLVRAPALLVGQWFLPPSDVTMLLGESQKWLYAVVATLLLVGLGVMIVRALRGGPDMWFWAAGMAGSVLPVCAVFSSDRLLSFVGIGAVAILARFMSAPRASPATRGLWAALIVVHAVLAPAAFVLRAAYPAGPPAIYDQLLVRTTFDASINEQDLIVVNAPSPFHAGFLPLMRDLDGEPAPQHTRILAAGLPAVVLQRPSADSLEVRPSTGYLHWVFDRLFRGREAPFRVGDRVHLTRLEVEIVELTVDGRPAAARFNFAVPLEHASLRWLQWLNGEFVPFTPPPIGEIVELRPQLSLLRRR
jgi:hypothetical protein